MPGRRTAPRPVSFVATLSRLLRDPLAGPACDEGLGHLRTLFAAGPGATGSVMAGRAEEGVGEPAVVSASVSVLAGDLLATLPVPTGGGRR